MTSADTHASHHPGRVVTTTPSISGTLALTLTLTLARQYLGGWPADDRLLPPAGEGKLGKLAVCDVTAELPKRVKSVEEDAYLVVPVWDSHAPSTAEMNAAVRWSVGKLEAGYVLYVHCAHGHGRSAVIAGGILRALGRASDVGAAVDLMRAARPLVKLNSRQLAALKDWDEKFN